MQFENYCEFIGYKFDKNDFLECYIKLIVKDGKLFLSTDSDDFILKLKLVNNLKELLLISKDQSEYIINEIIEILFTKNEETEYLVRVGQVVSRKLNDELNIKNINIKFNSNKSYFNMKNNYIEYEDNNIKVKNIRISNSKYQIFSINFNNSVTYDFTVDLIKKIRIFLCIVEGLKFYEEFIEYTLLDNLQCIDIFESSNFESNAKRFFNDRNKKIEVRVDLSKQEMNNFFNYWLSKCNGNESYLARLVEYYHRNDFSNPNIYFKDIFSFYEEIAKIESQVGKSYHDSLKKQMLQVIDEFNFDLTTKNEYKQKINLFTDNQTLLALGIFNSKINDILEIKFETAKKWYTIRNRITHNPIESYKEVESINLVNWIICIREIIVLYLLKDYFEVNNDIKSRYAENLNKMLLSYDL